MVKKEHVTIYALIATLVIVIVIVIVNFETGLE